MLALLGIALSQCESGRLTETVQIPRYAPSCCDGESYIWEEDVDAALVARMSGQYVTVAPGSNPTLEFPASIYLIANAMVLSTRTENGYVYLSYSSYPAGYPNNEPHTGAANYSIGGNSDQDVYNSYSHGNGPSVFRIYADECNSPPSLPPPPPIEGAMCEKGYWPLYPTEAEARAVSPANSTHTHEFNGVTFYMPDAFEGAMHAPGGVADCPWHATALPPNLPPHPPVSPPPDAPPLSPSPPAPPPPWEMPIWGQVLLITLIPAAIIVAIIIGWLAWCMWYASPRGQEETAKAHQIQRQAFVKLQGTQRI